MTDAPRPRILVIEDDLAIGCQLLRGLRAAGFAPELHTEGTGAVERVCASGCDAVVLDLTLPGEHGLDVLARLRDRTSAPVVVLTAGIDLDTRLRAFAAGAADFLPKPFFLEELVARVRARLGAAPLPRRVVAWGAVEVDLDARCARVGGEDAGLTAHEFNVLAHLASRPGKAATRSQICTAALSADGETAERTVDSHVTRIRRKLGPDGAAVQTVWGVGYRLDLPDTAR